MTRFNLGPLHPFDSEIDRTFHRRDRIHRRSSIHTYSSSSIESGQFASHLDFTDSVSISVSNISDNSH